MGNILKTEAGLELEHQSTVDYEKVQLANLVGELLKAVGANPLSRSVLLDHYTEKLEQGKIQNRWGLVIKGVDDDNNSKEAIINYKLVTLFQQARGDSTVWMEYPTTEELQKFLLNAIDKVKLLKVPMELKSLGLGKEPGITR